MGDRPTVRREPFCGGRRCPSPDGLLLHDGGNARQNHVGSGGKAIGRKGPVCRHVASANPGHGMPVQCRDYGATQCGNDDDPGIRRDIGAGSRQSDYERDQGWGDAER